MFRCHCGKFVKDVKATVNGFDEIKKVEGVCRVHGLVDITKSSDWNWEEFFGPEER